MTPRLPAPPRQLELSALDWPEVGAGDDIAALLCADDAVADGDVVVVTSKVVSKAEGRARYADRRDVVADESRRVLARRGDFVVAETGHGLVMAAAGVDASNTPPGTVLALPVDPDATARRFRERIASTGRNVAVLVTDTAGRAWRNGQTDMAIGCAGIDPLADLVGTSDPHGNVLAVTVPAIADEVAAAADLVKGKTTGRPIALVRGLAAWVLPVGEHGPGAAALVRPGDLDLFGLGAREAAVAAALRTDPISLAHFPPVIEPAVEPFAALAATAGSLHGARVRATRPDGAAAMAWRVDVDVPADPSPADLVAAGRLLERAEVIATAHRLRAREVPGEFQAGRLLLASVEFTADSGDVKGSAP